MVSSVTGQRVLVALLFASVSLSGGCATLDRDVEREDFRQYKTRLWVKPPVEDGDTPIVGFRIPW